MLHGNRGTVFVICGCGARWRRTDIKNQLGGRYVFQDCRSSRSSRRSPCSGCRHHSCPDREGPPAFLNRRDHGAHGPASGCVPTHEEHVKDHPHPGSSLTQVLGSIRVYQIPGVPPNQTGVVSSTVVPKCRDQGWKARPGFGVNKATALSACMRRVRTRLPYLPMQNWLKI